MSRRSVLGLTGAALVVSALPAAALYASSTDNLEIIAPDGHFLIVSGTALACACAAIVLAVFSARERHVRGGAVAVAFTLTSGMLAIHGLSTPGFIINGAYAGVVIGGAGAVPLGGAILAASVLLPARIERAARVILIAEIVATFAVVAFGVISLVTPELVPQPTVPTGWKLWVIIVVATGFYLAVAQHAARTFRFTRRRADLAVVVGLVWLATSIAAYLTSSVWSLSFWGAHVAQLVGASLIAGAIARDVFHRTPSRPLLREMALREITTSEEELLGGDVWTLLAALARKDPSTREHTRRVAELAVEVGQSLQLPVGRLRALAVAALLHDIGKLQTPTAILRKPGALDDDEFAIIKRHPQQGVDLLRHVGGFGQVEKTVLAHHERLDGSGYPHGLRGDEIPLEARILCVCDVYDALTSDRAYRHAWPPERALALLLDERGTKLDPAVVDAVQGLLGAPAALAA